MLRDKNLVPLSRQHQHALALCVRVDRAGLLTLRELKAWQSEIAEHFRLEIQYHFGAEEAHIFPAARRHPELAPLVDELLSEHAALRHDFALAAMGSLDRDGLRHFTEKLSTHIRKEERLLFEGMQKQMTPEELREIGLLVDAALADVAEVCITPTEATLKAPGAN